MDQAARYSVQERIKIIEVYFATKSVVQKLNDNFGGTFQVETLRRLAIMCLSDKFRWMGSVQDNIKGRSGRQCSVRTERITS